MVWHQRLSVLKREERFLFCPLTEFIGEVQLPFYETIVSTLPFLLSLLFGKRAVRMRDADSVFCIFSGGLEGFLVEFQVEDSHELQEVFWRNSNFLRNLAEFPLNQLIPHSVLFRLCLNKRISDFPLPLFRYFHGTPPKWDNLIEWPSVIFYHFSWKKSSWTFCNCFTKIPKT